MKYNLTIILVLLTVTGGLSQGVNEDLTHTPRYNGNISAIRWKGVGGSGEEQLNTYRYDGLNRLSGSMYGVLQSGSYQKDLGYFSVPSIGYDLNGNILNLQRQGQSLTNSKAIIDDLTYSYAGWGNRLRSVTDAQTDSLGFIDGNPSGDDYTYDANGNMISDANKGITKIEYNHLNLPTKVTFDAQHYITYLYDAAGIKLQQKVYKADTLYKTTDYIGEFIYEDGELVMIQHEEGRIVPKDTVWDYQYHLKDHLGNVRVTFSTEVENYIMEATMEYANESENFSNYVAEEDALASNSGTHVSRNSNLLNEGLDLNTFLQINKRDTVKVSAYAYYNDAGSSYDLAAGLIETALFGAFSSSYAAEGSTVTQTNFDNAFGNGTLLGGRSSSTTAPPAFINYIFFDREMDYITAGFKQITTSSNGSSVQVIADDFIADQDGYLLVYLSNETDQSSELIVSWDDLEVYHGKTNVVSTQDYYPGGATFNESVRTASSPQNFKFQTKEWLPNLRWYDFGPRGYDPFILRTNAMDLLADQFPDQSPYSFQRNNPILFIDPTGMAPQYNWDTEEYEDDEGNTISYQEAFAAHGIDTGGDNSSGDDCPSCDPSIYEKGATTSEYDDNGNRTDWVYLGDEKWGRKMGDRGSAPVGSDSDETASGSVGTAFVGLGGATANHIFDPKKGGFWMGKNFKAYDSSWGGNGSTGGKYKFSGNVGTGIKIGGYALGAYNFIQIRSQYRSGQLTRNQMLYEQTINGISTFGGIYGAAAGLGHELGKKYGPSKWYGSDDTKWFK